MRRQPFGRPMPWYASVWPSTRAGFVDSCGLSSLLGGINMKAKRRAFIGGASAAAVLSGSGVAFAQKKYDDGASDTEIKIGHCCPYSGPASAYGVIGKCHQAFWKAVNDAGGIN